MAPVVCRLQRRVTSCLTGSQTRSAAIPKSRSSYPWPLGYYFGSFTYKGLGLGAVTATLIAAVIIGQLGITISPPLKATVFLMFLFAVGYGVGPQFVRGIAKDGVPQALFAAVVCVFCLVVPFLAAKIAGYDVGSAAGLYAGSQTISASMGLATDAINRLGLPPEETKRLLDCDAGRLCRHLHFRHGGLGHRVGVDRAGACWASTSRRNASATRRSMAARRQAGGAGTAWHHYELRAYRVREGGMAVGLTARAGRGADPR